MKKKLDIREDVLDRIKKDMESYLSHGYTFQNFCDWNTEGQRRGNELKKLWKETENEYNNKK